MSALDLTGYSRLPIDKRNAVDEWVKAEGLFDLGVVEVEDVIGLDGEPSGLLLLGHRYPEGGGPASEFVLRRTHTPRSPFPWPECS